MTPSPALRGLLGGVLLTALLREETARETQIYAVWVQCCAHLFLKPAFVFPPLSASLSSSFQAQEPHKVPVV